MTTDQPTNPLPVTKYVLTVKVRGNTHEEIESELLTLTRGGYLLDSAYHTRDEWDSTSGRCSARMEHSNPEQTPENYAAELENWRTAYKAERKARR